MKTTVVLLLILLCTLSVYADIRPNPIKAKGIIAGKNTSIRMDSERVTVDLYKDSSVVECHFDMRNDGDAQKLTIGFPEMNFHYYGNNYRTENNKFCVYENGKQVKIINLHQPDTTSQKNQFGQVDIASVVIHWSDDEHWFLWDSEFEKAEMKTIVVRYTLPNWATKNGIRYFTYLLNTGSGWKGNIGKAEVVVNLKDLTPDLILKVTPSNYKTERNQLTWTFTDFEPTILDDIRISYEQTKGEYSQRKHDVLTILVDGKPFPGIDPIDLETMDIELFEQFLLVKVPEIVKVDVLKDPESLSKYNAPNGVLMIYTKNYLNDKPKDK